MNKILVGDGVRPIHTQLVTDERMQHTCVMINMTMDHAHHHRNELNHCVVVWYDNSEGNETQ
jgi:hypothetical protein